MLVYPRYFHISSKNKEWVIVV